MDLKKLYLDIYEQFLQKAQAAQGYDFQQNKSGSVPPKTVSFKDRLKWWSLDRPKRMHTLIQDRDRRQQEILALKNQRTTPPHTSASDG